MSWGSELWDQYDAVLQHTHKGIEILEKFSSFLKDRAAIEMEYASKLRKLAKSYSKEFCVKKKDDKDVEKDPEFTFFKAIKAILSEINDLAGQHELVGEELSEKVVRNIQNKSREMKDDKKRLINEGGKHNAALTSHFSAADRAKRNYEKAFRESQKAAENYEKANADDNLSRAEISKQRDITIEKSRMCEDQKQEYAAQLSKANSAQRKYYNDWMPNIFNSLQNMDESRIQCLRGSMLLAADAEIRVNPIIHRCLEGIKEAASSIDEKKDSVIVIEKYRTGLMIPDDLPFEDLSAIRQGQAPPLPSNGHANMLRADTINKGTLSSGKAKKRTGLFGLFGNSKGNAGNDGRDDYADLPPAQRRKKLQQKIDEFSAKIQQENAAKEGLLKMQDVYQRNTQLGDPNAIEGQLKESRQKLSALEHELEKYQSYLLEVDSPSPRYHTIGYNGINNVHNRVSGSDESLSRSASDLSQNKHSMPGTPLPSHGSSNSPESGISTSHNSIPDADFDQIDGDGDNVDYYDQENLPILGTCEALFHFDATSEGSIPMQEREQLLVIELDQGDGWTRVRRQHSLEEGFVPTSYIRISLYSNC